MPVKHKVDKERGILFVMREGTTSPEEEEASFAARKMDPAVVEGMPVFVDSRNVEPADSVETIRRIADIVTANAASLKCGRTAILVGNNVQYGMARMYAAMTEFAHPQTEIFRDYEEAMRWLLQAEDASHGVESAPPGA